MTNPDASPSTTQGLQYIGASHTRRVRVVVILGSLASICFGLPWAVYFVYHGDWLVTASDCLVILSGVVAVRMSRRNQLRGAAILLVVSLFARLVGISLLFDIPNGQIPRSIHHFLIPLGVAAYLMLKHETVWLRHGLAWGCLVGVVFFASSDFGFQTRYGLSASVRSTGIWINNISAMCLLLLLLHVFVTDIDRLESRLHFARTKWLKRLQRVLPRWLHGPLERSERLVASTIPEHGSPIPHDGTQGWLLVRAQRMRLVVMASSSLMICLGTVFAVYFAVCNALPLVVIDVALIALGLVLVALQDDRAQPAQQSQQDPQRQAARQRERWAVIGLVAGLWLIFWVTSAVMDVPTPDVPRSTHYWFLPLSLGAYFLLREENNWIHLGLPVACLAAFVVMASSRWGVITQYALADADRLTPWLVCTSALGVLYLLVHILVGDIKGLEDWLLGIIGRLWPGYRVS